MKLRRHEIPGTNLSVSTFSCGLGDLFSLPEREWKALLDCYVEAGGNFFDTAHSYCHWLPGGSGLSEISIGEYVRKNGVKNAVIATKGGHHSAWRYRTIYNDEYLSPGRLQADMDDSLSRLECDQIALYYLHRDDPRVPVGEIVDYLAMEIGRGRISYAGASNWTVDRLAAAQDYAKKNGRPGFVIASSLWSLATLKDKPLDERPYPQYGTARPEFIQWLEEHRFPLAPYTPTAHGYFAESRSTVVKDYETPENEARRRRAEKLAAENDLTPTQVILGWLISQRFPVFPVLGTKNAGRLLEALKADSIRWTREQCRWLAEG